jgi:hypothetical protein
MLKTAIAIFLLLILFTGCENETEFGECRGVLEEKDPNLYYDLSYRNIVLSVIFSETFFVPIIVVLDGYECPVARR